MLITIPDVLNVEQLVNHTGADPDAIVRMTGGYHNLFKPRSSSRTRGPKLTMLSMGSRVRALVSGINL
jgi:hypothetical protein